MAINIGPDDSNIFARKLSGFKNDGYSHINEEDNSIRMIREIQQQRQAEEDRISSEPFITKPPSEGQARIYNSADNNFINSREVNISEKASHIEKLYFISQSTSDLYIKSCNGMTRFLQGEPNALNTMEELVICRRFEFSNRYLFSNTVKEMRRYLNVTKGQASSSFKKIFNEFCNFSRAEHEGKLSNRPGASISVRIDYRISVNTIPPEGIYLRDLDIVIGRNSSVIHPGDTNFSSIDAMKKAARSTDCSGIVVQIVDNNHQVEPKYIYAAGEVQVIKPVQDSNQEDGVVTMRVYSDQGVQRSEEVSRLTVQEAKEQGIIYDTAEAAATSGDPGKVNAAKLTEALKELEFTKQDTLKTRANFENEKAYLEKEKLRLEYERNELENQIMASKKELEAYKQELERKSLTDKASHEAELAKLKQSNFELENMYKRRKMEMEDYFELRSYNRKDTSESMKYTPILITSIATAAAAYLALNK